MTITCNPVAIAAELQLLGLEQADYWEPRIDVWLKANPHGGKFDFPCWPWQWGKLPDGNGIHELVRRYEESGWNVIRPSHYGGSGLYFVVPPTAVPPPPPPAKRSK